MKDFAAEIRAHIDVEHFLSQAQLMLDMPETSAEQILDRMMYQCVIMTQWRRSIMIMQWKRSMMTQWRRGTMMT